MELTFDDQPQDDELLQRVAMAYEVAAIEGLEAILHPGSDAQSKELQRRAQASAWRAFELRRPLAIPTIEEQRLFHVLHLAGLAYCGDRWPDLRQWINDHPTEVIAPSTATLPWDRRVLCQVYDCWVRLLRKSSWDDLDHVREIVAELRQNQQQYEQGVLSNGSVAQDRAMAIRLIALYHWAKATELLAVYMVQGTPASVAVELDRHFEKAGQAAAGAQDAPLELVLRWLHLAARQMVAGSIWWVAGAVNSRVAKFVKSVTKAQAMFELLPPQRVSLQEQGLLDQAHRAIVVDMPTSGGKTLLAEFRMLQALNQFDQDKGWVAYVAPTRALVSQVTRRLRRDLEPFGVIVEQLTGAVEIDVFEEAMLTASDAAQAFHVLVSTPEKLQFVIRNNKVSRPLALIVMDEAHNIEGEERGLRIELLLATIRRDRAETHFLLLMPMVPNADELAHWLAADTGKAISIGTAVWRPNERIVGLFYPVEDQSVRAGWRLEYETLVTSPKTLHLAGRHRVDGIKPLSVPWSQIKGKLAGQTAAMAKVFSERGTSIAIANTIPWVWSMARAITDSLQPLDPIPDEIALVQRFLKTEISDDFELIAMLDRGVAVHHAGLSDEVRSLIEWLAEEGKLKVLCATTTIAQGINFPVSSVFLSSHKYPYGRAMSPREFWNLAGRAGRVGQDTVGVIGLARGTAERELTQYVADATGSLVSRLVRLLDELFQAGQLQNLKQALAQDQWRDFRCYVAHLWREKQNLDAVLADTEGLLRSTFGYSRLRSTQSPADSTKAEALLSATKGYVQDLDAHSENAVLADSTGFAPEGVRAALLGLEHLEHNLTPSDWEAASLFGEVQHSSLPNLIGVMLQIQELRGSLQKIGFTGLARERIALLTADWVNGKSLREIAETYFQSAGTTLTAAITDACKAIYRTLVNSGPWGMSALSKMPTSGLDFDTLPEDALQRINALPSMIYHGVRSEAAVLMRMNAVPRSVAEALGAKFQADSAQGALNVKSAREYLKSLNIPDWAGARPEGAAMSGKDYREVWQQLSGETES
jgi:replicative superfamily II helicase